MRIPGFGLKAVAFLKPEECYIRKGGQRDSIIKGKLQTDVVGCRYAFLKEWSVMLSGPPALVFDRYHPSYFNTTQTYFPAGSKIEEIDGNVHVDKHTYRYT